MSSGAGDIADRGQRSAMELMRVIATTASAEVRTGDGWLAVRSGICSNDCNGVVSERGAVPASLVPDLAAWAGAGGLPASWLLPSADAPLADALLGLGAHPERTGNWCGADLADLALDAGADWPEIEPVRTDGGLAEWLDLAQACGWLGSDDRGARARTFREIGLTDGPLRHWLARVDGRPVGFASALTTGSVIDLCTLGVLEPFRRRGIGRALALHRLRSAAGAGIVHAVAAPSQDGWELYRTLGFDLAPVVPDLCFYLEAG